MESFNGYSASMWSSVMLLFFKYGWFWVMDAFMVPSKKEMRSSSELLSLNSGILCAELLLSLVCR
jgi:hypothetical protein